MSQCLGKIHCKTLEFELEIDFDSLWQGYCTSPHFFFNTYSQGAPQIVKTQVVVKLRHTLRHSTCVSMSFGIIEPHNLLGDHSRSNGRAEVAGRQMFEKFRQLHIDEPGRNWYNSPWRVLQAYQDLPGPTGLSPHRILFLRDRVSRTLPWLNHGKVARDANAMMAEADDTAAKVCKALQDEHEKRAKYFKQGKVKKYALRDTVWVERHHKDVLSRHRQASWYVPWVIVRKVGQDVYAVRVGDNKILDRDHTQLRPRAPDPSGRPVTFEFTAGDVDSDDEGEDDDFTAERIVTDKPDPGTPGGRLYKVRWKGFAASRDSWEPPSSFVPRYTTVWMEYLKRKNISLDVKDVLVHLVAAVAP